MTSDAPSGSLVKALLPESEMPTHWYNIQADLPEPMAPHLRSPFALMPHLRIMSRALHLALR